MDRHWLGHKETLRLVALPLGEQVVGRAVFNSFGDDPVSQVMRHVDQSAHQFLIVLARPQVLDEGPVYFENVGWKLLQI